MFIFRVTADIPCDRLLRLHQVCDYRRLHRHQIRLYRRIYVSHFHLLSSNNSYFYSFFGISLKLNFSDHCAANSQSYCHIPTSLTSSSSRCFLKPGALPFYLFFFLPLTLVIVVNLVFFVMVLNVIRSSKNMQVSQRELLLVSL